MPRKKQPRKMSESGRAVRQKRVRDRRIAPRGTVRTGSKAVGAGPKRHELLLDSLSAAALAAQNALTPDALFDAMSKILLQIGIQSTVLLIDEDKSSFIMKYLSYPSRILAAGRRIAKIEPMEYRIPIRAIKEYRKVIHDKSAVFIEDAAEFLRRFLPGPASRYSGKIARLLGVRQFIIAPLVSEGHVFGLLAVQSNTLTRNDMISVNVFAGQLAGVWRRTELFEEAQEEINRRREVETFLIEERDRFRSTLDVAGVILVAINAAGNVIMINRKGQDILGYAKQDLIGKNWFDTCLPADSKKEVKAVFRDLVSGKGGLSEYVENRIVTRSGEERIIAWHNTVLRGAGGKITGTLSSGEDVTERKKIEQALMASEKKFRTLVESVHDIVFTLDTRQKHTGVFGRAMTQSGIFNNVFVGKTAREIWGDEAGAIHEAANLQALKDKQVVYDWSVPGPEDIAYFQTSLSPLKDSEGRVTGLVGIGRNVTIQKQNERLIRLQRDLVRDLGSVTTLQEVTQRCIRATLDVSQMDSGGVYVLDPPSGDLVLIQHHGLRSGFIKAVSRLGSNSPRVKLVLKGEPIFTEYLNTAIPKRATEIREGLKAFAMVPILHEGRVIGCINVASHTRNTVPHFSRESLEIIAHEIGGSIAGLEVKGAFEKSEEKYKTLIETTDTGYVVLDSKGIVLEANKEYAKLTGHTKIEELIGRNVVEWTAPYDRKRNALEVDRCLKQGFVKDLEIDYVDSRGRITPIEINATVMRGVMGIQILTLCRDITERKRSEESLRESEERFSRLSAAAFEGIGITEQGIIVDANEQLEKMMGFAAGEMAGMNVMDLVAPQSRDFVAQNMKKNYQEPYEHLAVRKDGSIFPVEIHAGSILYKDRTARVSAIRDMTERKKAEEALRQSESKYRSIVLAAPVGVGVVEDRVFKEVNESLCSMTGYSREELIGRSSRMVYPDEKEFLRVGRVKYAEIREKGVGHIETRWKRKDGEVHDIFLSSAPIDADDPSKGTTFTALDITERKRSEKFLQESEMKYRALVENSLIGIGISKGNRIVYANRLMIIYGFTDFSELASKPLLDYLTPPSQAVIREWRQRSDRGEPVPMEMELDIMRKDGGIRTLRLSLAHVTIDKENYIYSTFIDVTERKRTEEALRQENAFRNTVIRSAAEGLAVCHGISEYPFVRFTVWNDRMTEVTGYTMEEINRLGWYQTMYPDPEIRERAVERMSRMRKGDDIVGEEWIVTRSDGEKRTLSISTSILDTGNDEIHVLAMMQDVTERKYAEQALKESEQQYRTTIDSMGNAIHVIDADMRFVLFNKAFQDWNRRLGLSLEVIGKGLFDVFPFLQKSVRGEYDGVFRSGEVLSTQENTHVGGQEISTETRKIPILKDKKVIQVVTVVTDVTERKSAEKALRRNEELFRQLAENIHEVFWVRDFRTRRIEYISPAFEEVWGRPCRSMYDDSELFVKTIHPDDLGRMQASIEKQRRTGVLDEQYRIIRPDRGIRWIRARTYPVEDAKGSVYRTVGVAEDITNFKRAEESLSVQHRALLESSAALNAFINALPEPAMLLDTRYRILVANSAMSERLGRGYAEMVGLDAAAVLPPDMWESRKKIIDSVIQTGQNMHFEDVQAGRFFVNTVAPAFNSVGEVTRIAVFTLDITDRIKAEETLKKSQDAFRLASLGTLAAGISHEINQPLTALKVKVDGMLYWGTENPDLLQKNLVPNLQFISDEAEKIDHIIQHMRSLIRRERHQPESVDINSVVQKSLTLIGQQMASHGIRLELDLDPAKPVVAAQEVSMEEVVVNLLSNAVHILDTIDQDDKTVRIATKMESNTCLLKIEDNGPGIPETHIERIFDPLFTTRETGQGMGLGLSIVQRLLEEYGGRIRASNRAGGGALFTVELPLFGSAHPEAS